MENAVAQKTVRTEAVDGPTFARIFNRVAVEGGGEKEVIEAVEKETGVRMKPENLAVKASGLRRKGVHLLKLARKNRQRIDVEALNAELDAIVKVNESEKTETEAKGEETKSAE